MKEREVLAAAEAVFDAERALRRAAETVAELGDVAASSLRVLDDAATDAFYAPSGGATGLLPGVCQ